MDVVLRFSGGMFVLALQLTVDFFAHLRRTLRRQKQDLRKTDLDARVIASINHMRIYAACVPRGVHPEVPRFVVTDRPRFWSGANDHGTVTEVFQMIYFVKANETRIQPSPSKVGQWCQKS